MSESGNTIGRLHANQQLDAEPSDEALAKRALADSIRGLCHVISSSGASAEEMRAMTDQLNAHRDVLAATKIETSSPIAGPAGSIEGMEDFRDRSPIAGHANPLAAPLSVAADPDAELVRGEVTFGPAFEGAPGCVHGGFVAAVLDEALGMACIFSGGPGMTGELTTRYLKHTPISQPLRIEARLVSVDGRKIRTAGEVYHGDQVVAEGHGLFIAVDLDKFRQLAAAKSDPAGS
jgi:acyl-coenzyme A thioesterase PaaI-like protein